MRRESAVSCSAQVFGDNLDLPAVDVIALELVERLRVLGVAENSRRYRPTSRPSFTRSLAGRRGNREISVEACPKAMRISQQHSNSYKAIESPYLRGSRRLESEHDGHGGAEESTRDTDDVGGRL